MAARGDKRSRVVSDPAHSASIDGRRVTRPRAPARRRPGGRRTTPARPTGGRRSPPRRGRSAAARPRRRPACGTGPGSVSRNRYRPSWSQNRTVRSRAALATYPGRTTTPVTASWCRSANGWGGRPAHVSRKSCPSSPPATPNDSSGANATAIVAAWPRFHAVAVPVAFSTRKACPSRRPTRRWSRPTARHLNTMPAAFHSGSLWNTGVTAPVSVSTRLTTWASVTQRCGPASNARPVGSSKATDRVPPRNTSGRPDSSAVVAVRPDSWTAISGLRVTVAGTFVIRSARGPPPIGCSTIRRSPTPRRGQGGRGPARGGDRGRQQFVRGVRPDQRRRGARARTRTPARCCSPGRRSAACPARRRTAGCRCR